MFDETIPLAMDKSNTIIDTSVSHELALFNWVQWDISDHHLFELLYHQYWVSHLDTLS